jgi:hypothetical protein
LNAEKLNALLSQVKTHEIALTINCNFDETMSLMEDDDTNMQFQTFIDSNETYMFNTDATLANEEQTEVVE